MCSQHITGRYFVSASMKDPPKRKGNAWFQAVLLLFLGASMKALPKRKGNKRPRRRMPAC